MLKFNTEAQRSPQLKAKTINSSNLLKLLVGTILLGSVNGIKLNFDPNTENIDHLLTRRNNSTKYPPLLKSKLFKGKYGGVASENGECSKIGVEILKKGGNAVDSVIATGICQGTLSPFSSGIGGGGFAVIKTDCDEVEFIDFRETAPQKSNSTMYNDNYNASLVGGLSVGVPGEIRGYELLHKKYGKLPWSKLFEPSIKLAENGFEAGPELVKRLDGQKKWLLNNTEFVKIYAPSGQLVKVEDIVYRKNYAKTLKKIAKEGSKGFYEGEIAQEIADYVQKNGGILTLEDLKNYKVLVKEPSVGTFLGSKVISTTAPSSGSILVSTLQLLDSVIRQNGTGSQVDLYHRFVEVLKFGFSARTRIGDPAYNSTITPFEKEIVKKDYTKKLLPRVDLKHTHDFNYYNPSYDTKELPGTTHISVIDKDGFTVSLTTTVNMNFGAQLMTPKFGIILNDEMNDFSVPNVSNGFGLAPSPLNWVQPGKRPLSSTVPTILVKEDGEIIALGGAGGSLIISATAQVLVEIFLNKKGLQEAVDNARIHNQLLPQITQVEQSFNQTLIDGLVAKSHNVTKWSNLSQVQIVTKKCDGSVEALSDFRKYALAYAY